MDQKEFVMIVIKTPSEFQKWREKQSDKTIGFVPTMGYLHDGHLSLIKQAKTDNDRVVASIFVNPLQFGAGEDFTTYPRDLLRDRELAKEAGVDVLFLPDKKDMYPSPMASLIRIMQGIDTLCGKNRPGHFDGVATVVMKLFQIVQPNSAYFGLKDAQQVAVIERMVKDYFVPIEIVRVPTVREADGLAKSSRNVHLTDAERRQASAIYRTLSEIKEHVMSGKETIMNLELAGKKKVEEETKSSVDYFTIRHFPSLDPVEQINEAKESELIIACAVAFSEVRLIDNIIFKL